MIHSMTAFASGTGAMDDWSWAWELRSVNARGLDLRLRLPDWIDGLEPALRAVLQKTLSRGSVSLGLRLTRGGGDQDGPDADAIDTALARIVAVHGRASAQGVQLAPSSAMDVLNLSAGQGGAANVAPTDRAVARGAAGRIHHDDPARLSGHAGRGGGARCGTFCWRSLARSKI